jgi:peptidoglycan/LPS O-acetylase OafA/YrhL
VSRDTSPGSFRPEIQGLRALAVTLVVLCHAGVPFLAGGYIGVDVFFVVSGFLITRWLLGRAEAGGGVPFAASMPPAPGASCRRQRWRWW